MMLIKIIPVTPSKKTATADSRKLADVELHFTAGPLDGLKLLGFSIWKIPYYQSLKVLYPGTSVNSITGKRELFPFVLPIIAESRLAQQRLSREIMKAYELARPINPPTIGEKIQATERARRPDMPRTTRLIDIEP